VRPRTDGFLFLDRGGGPADSALVACHGFAPGRDSWWPQAPVLTCSNLAAADPAAANLSDMNLPAATANLPAANLPGADLPASAGANVNGPGIRSYGQGQGRRGQSEYGGKEQWAGRSGAAWLRSTVGGRRVAVR
jgi:hypothetical protein